MLTETQLSVHDWIRIRLTEGPERLRTLETASPYGPTAVESVLKQMRKAGEVQRTGNGWYCLVPEELRPDPPEEPPAPAAEPDAEPDAEFPNAYLEELPEVRELHPMVADFLAFLELRRKLLEHYPGTTRPKGLLDRFHDVATKIEQLQRDAESLQEATNAE